jgi:hypothetical protein
MTPVVGTGARARIIAGCTLGGVIALAMAPAALARPVPFAVTKAAKVKSSGVTTLTVACPRSATALAGAVRETSTGVSARELRPTGADRWTFRFTARQGVPSPHAAAQVRCLRLRPKPGVRHWKVTNLTASSTVRVGGRSTRRVQVRCLSGYLATGYGVAQSAGGPEQAVPAGEIRLAGAVPSRSGFTFSLENAGAEPQRVTTEVRCLARKATARKGDSPVTQSFVVNRARFTDQVRSGGRRLVRHSCPRGSYGLATGVSLSQRDDISLTRTYPNGSRGGLWLFDHRSGKPQSVRTYLTCLNLRTEFG